MKPLKINPWAFGPEAPIVFTVPWSGGTTGVSVTLNRVGKEDMLVSYPATGVADGVATFAGDDRLTEIAPGRYFATVTDGVCKECYPVNVLDRCAAGQFDRHPLSCGCS